MLVTELYYHHPEVFKSLDCDLEEWYSSSDCVYNRLFKDGKKVGKAGVIEKFQLQIKESHVYKDIMVKLVSKENQDYVPFNRMYDINTGKVTYDGVLK